MSCVLLNFGGGQSRERNSAVRWEKKMKKQSSRRGKKKENNKTPRYLSSVLPFELQQDAALEPQVLLVASRSESERDHGRSSSSRRRGTRRWLVDAGSIGDGLRVDARASVADGDEAAHGGGSIGMRAQSDV